MSLQPHPFDPSLPLPSGSPQRQGIQSNLLATIRFAGELFQRLVGRDLSEHDYAVGWLTYRLINAAGPLASEYTARQALMAGFLHDMGKYVLPAELLNKSAPLSNQERQQIMSHPVLGYTYLQDVPGIDETVLSAILHHHERYDGMGYPVALSGESIPLLSRAICIAEVFHALISEQPYRAAQSREFAVDYLRTQQGRFFDPRLTEIFIDQVLTD